MIVRNSIRTLLDGCLSFRACFLHNYRGHIFGCAYCTAVFLISHCARDLLRVATVSFRLNLDRCVGIGATSVCNVSRSGQQSRLYCVSVKFSFGKGFSSFFEVCAWRFACSIRVFTANTTPVATEYFSKLSFLCTFLLAKAQVLNFYQPNHRRVSFPVPEFFSRLYLLESIF